MRIEYPQAVLDPDTGELVSCAEVAEVEYTAFNSHGSKAVPGRLIVRRVPERNTNTLAAAAQEGLFTVCRQHAIFTNNPASLGQHANPQHSPTAPLTAAAPGLSAISAVDCGSVSGPSGPR